MRYYAITVKDPASGKVWSVAQNGAFALGSASTTFSSLTAAGAVDPGALDIELDAPVVPFDTPQGKATIRVWGVPLQALSQAANLNGATLEVRAGMSAGLPLAKPAQAGLILRGQAFQAFGNWEGKNQTVDIVAYPSMSSDGMDIPFLWPAGTPLSTALSATFASAFPGTSSSVAISPFVLPNTEAAHFTSLSQLATYVKRLTAALGQSALGSSYPGVSITVQGSTLLAYDGTATTRVPVTQLAFEDLVGQPTWIGPTTVNFKTVMRADLSVGSKVKFPAGVVAPYALTGAAAAYPNAPARSKSVFQGAFQIIEVHHFGHFRQASAEAWVTAFSAVPIQQVTPQLLAATTQAAA